MGNWSNSQQCYMSREEPQPPFSDPRWQGHTDGSIWACARKQGYDLGEHLVSRWVWLPGEPDTVVIDPLTLAYRAIAAMRLAKPLVRSAPGVGQIGLVNMPVWLWVEKTESTWGPITRSATVPGLSVTATAQVEAINWSMGDGNTIRCEGAGTPYDKSRGVKDSPDCGHRYKKASRELSDCSYPVTATAQWNISWQSTLGDTGELSVTQQAATQLRIGEAVPVLVDPDGGEAVAPAKGGCG
ncbi:ATP/GTP-binding protein [Kribbella capetownensis]|uniref:ATP/GTP-binding protein n=1 Tax=Kribbella capetownensis TaxID=1572659 RepID=A0A4R0JZZ6_9ACTN|nr:ATP/GTP-binding protein [Kribbella capetownensis]TCC51006.1 ATP/GTP-binding protein [Kribbella capetownensis]